MVLPSSPQGLKTLIRESFGQPAFQQLSVPSYTVVKSILCALVSGIDIIINI